MVVCSILIGDFSMFTKYTAGTSSIYYISPDFNILISSIKEKEKISQESSLPPLYIQRISLCDETDIFFNDCNTMYRKCIDMFTCLFGSLILFITIWKQRAIFRSLCTRFWKTGHFRTGCMFILVKLVYMNSSNMYWLKWCNQDVYFHRIENGKNGKLSINL